MQRLCAAGMKVGTASDGRCGHGMRRAHATIAEGGGATRMASAVRVHGQHGGQRGGQPADLGTGRRQAAGRRGHGMRRACAAGAKVSTASGAPARCASAWDCRSLHGGADGNELQETYGVVDCDFVL